MNTRRIGSLNVTVVGVGCNNFGRRISDDASIAVVHAALDAGINFFDTADIYGETKSEILLGQALAGRRNEAIIATKFGNKLDEERKGARPEYVKRACEDSLRRMKLDVIDLYQLHRPDADTPIADTIGAMGELVAEGKVREIGCSNFTVAQLREADAAVTEGAAKFVSVQNHYSLFHCEPEQPVLEECERTGKAYLPYFPLASGLLTGKHRKNQPRLEGTRLSPGNPRGDELLTEKNLTKVENLIAYAEARGHTILELAFGWLLWHQVIPSVIAGASSPAQIAANAASASWMLTDIEVADINAIMAD